MAFQFGQTDYPAQIAELTREVQHWRGAIHEKVRKAVEATQKADAAQKRLDAIENNSRKVYDNQDAKIKAAEEATMEAQRDRDDLLTKIQRLSDELDGKEKHISHIEKQTSVLEEELKGEKEKIAALHVRIKDAKEEAASREKWIGTVEEHAAGFEKEAKELKKDKQYLENQVAYEKGELARETRSLGILQTRYDKLRNETQGVRDLLANEQAQNAHLIQNNKDLQETITALQHVQAEIIEEKKISQGLRAQWDRLKDELPRFDPSPKLAIAPPAPAPNGQRLEPSKTPQSLANELEWIVNRSSSGSSHESGAESSVKVSSSESSDSSSSSDDDDDNDNDTEVAEPEIIEVAKLVHDTAPPQTIRIYVPFQTSAHSSILCWFMVEVNLSILFRLWLYRTVVLAGRAVPWLQSITTRAARTRDGPTAGPASPTNPNEPPSNGTLIPASVAGTASIPISDSMSNVSNILGPAPGADSSSAGSSENPPNCPPTFGKFSAADGSRSEQSEPSGTPIDPKLSKIAEIIEPIVSNDDGRATYPPGEQSPRAEHIPRHWFGINIEPYRVPPVFSTLIAFAFHMIFYWALYVCYRNYCEREIWLEANDAARRLVVDIIALRAPDGRRFASHLFSEQVVSKFDRFVLATFSTLFNIEPQPWNIPG